MVWIILLRRFPIKWVDTDISFETIWDKVRRFETIWDNLRRFETKQIYLLRQTETSEIYLSLDIGNSTAATVFHLFHCTHAFLKQKASIHLSICQAVRPSICPSVYPLVCLSIRQSLHRLCFHKNPPLEICPCTMFWDPAQPRFILGRFYSTLLFITANKMKLGGIVYPRTLDILGGQKKI